MRGYLGHRRLSAPTSGSLRRRQRDKRRALETRNDGERILKEKNELLIRQRLEQQHKVTHVILRVAVDSLQLDNRLIQLNMEPLDLSSTLVASLNYIYVS